MEETLSAHYTVKTQSFEGPLELLLSLIENRKLFVNDISLAQVTDDYISHVRTIQNDVSASKAIEQMTGFIVVAATLMVIKSRSLLPNLELTKEEQGQVVDLERRLKLYQMVQEIGVSLKAMYGTSRLFFREEKSEPIVVFAPDPSITKESLASLIDGVMTALPEKEALPQISVKKIVSIEEMIDQLAARIQEGMRLSFNTFSGRGGWNGTKEEKVSIVVTFLAMLELVRQGIVSVVQDMPFGDVSLEKQTTVSVTSLQENNEPLQEDSLSL